MILRMVTSSRIESGADPILRPRSSARNQAVAWVGGRGPGTAV